MNDRFRINTPDVSAEAFDDEIIAINLSNGHYHSLRGIAFQIWTLLEKGYSLDETSAALKLAFPGGPDAIVRDVGDFAAELHAAGLIVPASPAAGDPLPPIEPLSLSTIPGGNYAKPVIESFTDMESLLLLDPIHEVDLLTGWPRRPDDPAEDNGTSLPDAQNRN